MAPLYVVIYPPNPRYSEASVVNGRYGVVKEKCPVCDTPLSAREIDFPVCLEISNSKMPDFLYVYGMNVPFVVSEKCKGILEKNHVSGITDFTKIDKIINKKGESIATSYYLPEIQRIELPINRKLSKISYNDSGHSICPICNPMGKTIDLIFGLYFDTSKINDMDIFKTFELGDCVLVSQNFVNIMKKDKATNFECEIASQYDSNLKNLFDAEELKKMFGTDTLG